MNVKRFDETVDCSGTNATMREDVHGTWVDYHDFDRMRSILELLVNQSEVAMNYLDCCAFIRMKEGTKYAWPSELKSLLKKAKEELAK